MDELLERLQKYIHSSVFQGTSLLSLVDITISLLEEGAIQIIVEFFDNQNQNDIYSFSSLMARRRMVSLCVST